MATVVFDLDSTLYSRETLEDILTAKVDLKTQDQIRKITEQGMAGEIPFIESLKKRLALAKLSQSDLLPLIHHPESFFANGVPELISELQEESIDIWIVSGSIREIVIAAGSKLNIPKERCLGVELQWDQSGHFAGLDETLPINRAKWEEARNMAAAWSHPSIAVGDGMTDYALKEHGVVDFFIAFTEFKRRQQLLDKGVPQARNIPELKQELGKLLHEKT